VITTFERDAVGSKVNGNPVYRELDRFEVYLSNK